MTQQVQQFRPFYDRVLVRRAPEPAVPKGAIEIPKTAKEKPLQGEVLAVGPGRATEQGGHYKPHAHRGDQVLFGSFAGTDILLDGEKLLILRDEEILGVLEPVS